MKKIFAKIALFVILNLICLNLSLPVYAQANTPPSGLEVLIKIVQDAFNETVTYVKFMGAIDDAKLKPCLKITKTDGTDDVDANYITITIEEPLSLEQSTTTTAKNDDFESRICYKNSFTFTAGTETETLTKLSRICADNIQFLGTNFTQQEITNYKIRASCKAVQVLLSKGGTSLIEGYIATIYKWGASMVGIIAVLVIIISAIQISAAGGDTEAINSAKGRIIKSISGIVILFLSGLILYTINPTFFTK